MSQSTLHWHWWFRKLNQLNIISISKYNVLVSSSTLTTTYCLNGFETVPNIVICDKYHFKLYLIWIASLSTMQLIQKKAPSENTMQAPNKQTIFLNYNIKSKNSNTDNINWTAEQKLTLCWWLSLLFSDDVQNRLLSVKQNIFHTHHLTTHIENTIRQTT